MRGGRYLNHYRCSCCGFEWQDRWSCECNDRCSQCNREIEPYKSDFTPTDRTLAWATKEQELVAVNEMEDQHLINCINLLRRKIAGAKLMFGKTSLSLLTLQYLEAEANDRGLDHEDLG